jgi:hypothetical protein
VRWGIFSALFAVLLALPAGALAAPPANDDFANRQVLTGPLPLEVTASNVEATKEEGEFIPGLSPAGHSVWFEWEAEADGWVTIGACDDEFPTILAVFTGTDLGHLTQVAGNNASEGPDCMYSQQQYTFEAVSGTKYVIAVDGNNYHLPEGPQPVTEGSIVLRIESTPIPANDDFEDAATVEGSISEEPDGTRFLFAATRGYNWNATTESGEPDGGTTGASVWYAFTAPETATYQFACCGPADLVLTLFTGNSIGSLTQLTAEEPFNKVELAVGETVQVRIAGSIDSESEKPLAGSFEFFIGGGLVPGKPDQETPTPLGPAQPAVPPIRPRPRSSRAPSTSTPGSPASASPRPSRAAPSSASWTRAASSPAPRRRPTST